MDLERRIDGRYLVQQLLGRGGMAAVYRVLDERTGQSLALKQLTAAQTGAYAGMAALFEREFHTLLSLSHPRVIGVYDCGVDPTGPYYTMELLDGGDLRDQAPLPWREACALCFDICSSLALLHSRRLLHHDITPRNIRRTHDGRAKLIDFGAMTPMGIGSGQLVGTPPFVSPEALHRSALDARADLFSLGAALYYALTGKLAYPARSFAEVQQAWTERPAPPSLRAHDVPRALDELVLSLLSIEPGLRPQSAYDVMQRLAAIADLPLDEAAAVSQAYLATPLLVGRQDALAELRAHLTRARDGRGAAVIVRGSPGSGRTRILDACAVEAKTLGATVLRAAASGTRRSFAVALDLARHLLDALPQNELAPNARAELEQLAQSDESQRLQELITRLVLDVSRTRLLVIAVDDLQRIDEPSAAVLVALADRARRRKLLLALTAPSGAERSSYALEVLATRCADLTLPALSREETQALLSSVFGDVANLELVAREIFGVANGNPRQTLDVAQHLVDRELVCYAAGTWSLPNRVVPSDLPQSADAAIGARLEALSTEARLCIEALSLAYEGGLALEQYRALLPHVESSAVDAALSELVARQAVESDGHTYQLASRMWADAVRKRLSPERRSQHHRALAQLYGEQRPHARVYHLIEGGDDEAGLDALIALHANYAQGFDYESVREAVMSGLEPSYLRAIEVAERLDRPAREIAELRRWASALSASSSADLFWSVSPHWLAQLTRDSGLDEYRRATELTDAGARLMHALTRASEQHAALPERDRVYRVDEAIPRLAEYVTHSIAVGSRTLNTELLSSLPPLLEPFTALSPLLDAMLHNAIATIECARDARYEAARDRWFAVYEKLAAVSGGELQYVDAVRNALAYGVGVMDASFGISAASSWADLIENDPMQHLGALQLRKIVRLEQGDWPGADRLRREAEVYALQSRTPSMFHYTLTVEVSAYAGARDLLGLQQVIARFEELAAHSPGWFPYLLDAQARFHLLRGDFAAAKLGFEQTLQLTALDAERRSRMLPVWVTAQAGLTEALLGMGAYAEAAARARDALAICAELQIRSHAADLVRALALAEAKLGAYPAACARLDALIAEQNKLGTTGLRLGLSHEARAQIAIWARDEPAFEEFSRLTAREYRYGVRCPLSARYERLTNEARTRGLSPPAQLDDYAPTTSEGFASGSLPMTSDDYASRVLRSICERRRASAGHLYVLDGTDLRYHASCGADRPPDALQDQLQRYADQELERAETGSDLDGETQLGTIAQPTSIARANGRDYELVVLSRVIDHAGRIAGVIAFEGGVLGSGEAAMLGTLATFLLGGRAGSGS